MKSYDGSSTVTGELLSYKDGTYDIATPLGDLRIPAILVACVGASCPAPSQILSDLQASGDIVLGESPLHLDEAGNLVSCPETLAELALSGAS